MPIMKRLQGAIDVVKRAMSGPQLPYRVFNSINGELMPMDSSTRLDGYVRREKMLNNTYYYPGDLGGYKEEVLQTLFDSQDEGDVIGVYNPVKEIVESYQNVFRGRYGREIRIDPMVGGDDGRPVNPALLPANANVVGRIWQMSNLDTRKQPMQSMAANLGAVGIRVVAKPSNDEFQRRAFLQFEHPAKIKGFDEDDRGNVTEVELEYSVETGPIDDRKTVTVHEVLNKDEFVREIDGEADPTLTQTTNDLGVCPYVILRHEDNDTPFGRHAYAGSEQIIHALNLIFSNTSQSVFDHVWPTWFGTGSGEDPHEIETGKQRMLYARTDPDNPVPTVNPLVARLDFGGAINLCTTLIDHLVARNPELLFSHIKALSGQSGETIAKLQIAGIAAVERAKGNYEDALTRAIKIAISFGILYDMWDLGTGMGSISAAEQAFQTGLEDFEFMGRPVMPESVYEILNRAKITQAEGQSKADYVGRLDGVIPTVEKLKQLGYSDSEAQTLYDQLVKEQKARAPVATKPKQQIIVP